MATFKKGQSMKGQRVHVTSHFAQTGPGMTGQNVAFSISNDTKEIGDVMTNPMLVYGKTKDGTKDVYTASYSAKQWEAIEKMANKDGDKLVLEADLFPDSKGKGLVVNTNTLKTPSEPFNQAAHEANTIAAREAKKQAREAANQQQEQEAELEADSVGAEK